MITTSGAVLCNSIRRVITHVIAKYLLYSLSLCSINVYYILLITLFKIAFATGVTLLFFNFEQPISSSIINKPYHEHRTNDIKRSHTNKDR